MAVDFGKVMERSTEGYHALSWALYFGSAAIAISTVGEISGTILFLGCIAVIVMASSRLPEAASTIYGSHLENVKRVMTINLIASLILIAATWLTLGIGIIITWPLFLVLLVWTGFKLIRGMMKLNDGVGY